MNIRQALLINADTVARSNDNLGRNIARSNRELGEKLETISKAEIKSKDRVNISLAEYENMKDQISSLSAENRKMRYLLKKIDIPLDKNIIPDSIQTRYTYDPTCLVCKFMVCFDINESEIRDHYARYFI